jgi:hypothetical protein
MAATAATTASVPATLIFMTGFLLDSDYEVILKIP